MRGTFNTCKNLIDMYSIPYGVTNMYGTFAGCSNLINTVNIPNSIRNISNMFKGCSSLTKVPTIPNSVIVLVATFKGCSDLQGVLEINANVTGKQLGEEFYNNIDYHNCLVDATNNEGIKLKLTGSCPVLQQIVENANNPNIT